MNTDLLFSNIARHILLNADEKAHFSAMLQEQSLKKNEFVQKQGEPCRYIHFVNSGTLRAYCINQNGKESTVMFAIQGWWITDMYCFLQEQPAMVYIQAVEPAQILSLSKNDMDSLYDDIPAFNKFFRILMQNAYCREQLRMIQNLSVPAIDRYESFLRKYADIASKVPLKQIASYLGVTPEFLSTIRARKS